MRLVGILSELSFSCSEGLSALSFPTLREWGSFLEIVFVGLCEVFVCLEICVFFFFFFFSLGREAHRSAPWV